MRPATQGGVMTVKYSVTFEFPMRPPLTHRGIVEAGQVHVCMARATKEAKRLLRPVAWSSVVCVLLERVGESKETEELEPEVEVEV
jgi:hypothetical protein